MKVLFTIVASIALLALAAGCSDSSAPAPTPVTKPAPNRPRVELQITRGNEDWGKIVIELFEDRAPVTAKNFLTYVQEGYYDGTIFHRIIPDFMIQGGGYTAIGQPEKAGQHEPIKNESTNGLPNSPLTVAMARTGDPHSATSEFFINTADNRKLNAQPPKYGYAVFGRVIEGKEVVDRIRKVETKANPSGEKSQPLDPPMIKKAVVVK